MTKWVVQHHQVRVFAQHLVHEKNQGEGVLFSVAQMLGRSFQVTGQILVHQLHFVGLLLRNDLYDVLIAGGFQERVDTGLVGLYRRFDLGLVLVDLFGQLTNLREQIFKLRVDRVCDAPGRLGIELVHERKIDLQWSDLLTYLVHVPQREKGNSQRAAKIFLSPPLISGSLP